MKVEGKCYFLKIFTFCCLCAKCPIIQFDNLRCVLSWLECMKQNNVGLLNLHSINITQEITSIRLKTNCAKNKQIVYWNVDLNSFIKTCSDMLCSVTHTRIAWFPFSCLISSLVCEIQLAYFHRLPERKLLSGGVYTYIYIYICISPSSRKDACCVCAFTSSDWMRVILSSENSSSI